MKMDTNIDFQNTENEAYNNPETDPAPEPNYVQVSRTTASDGMKRSKPPKQRGGLVGFMLAAMLMLGMLLGGAGAEAVTLLAGNTPAVATSTATQATTSAATSTTSA